MTKTLKTLRFGAELPMSIFSFLLNMSSCPLNTSRDNFVTEQI